MADERFERLRSIFLAARARPAAERDRYLADVCGADDVLLNELRELLNADISAAETAEPLAAATRADVLHAAAPESIGPYHLIEPLGEGGMGTVYKAQQRAPIRRVVALKLIRPGLDTRDVVARFDAERQVLAMLDHPGIAKVFDAGTTDTGRPYFVMEYVPGLPVTQFADEQRLSVRQRLELFCQICDAVAHAHTKAIIHRDIKASNVLAYLHDGRPTVKVIDFGIAKALTGGRIAEHTVHTAHGHAIGTYESMSPEQAAGSADIDTRTDVYSLGVLLYELLTGAQPFEAATLRKAGEDEIRRIIREVDPPRPSTRLSGLGAAAAAVGQRRQQRTETLVRQLRDELEWIPLKAMRKERDRRYGSATELRQDVENYLNARALIAGPESQVYRLRKLGRRYRLPLSAAAVMLLLLITGIVTTSWQALRATHAEAAALAQQAQTERQRQEAVRANENTAAINEFLVKGVLRAADPAVQQGKELTVRAALDNASGRLDSAFKERPLIEATIRDAIAMTYVQLGRADLGVPHERAVLETRTRLLGPDHPDTLTALSDWGSILAAQAKYAEAEGVLRDALARRRRVLGETNRDTLFTLLALGNVLEQRGNLVEADDCSRRAVDGYRQTLGPDHPQTLAALADRGALNFAQGKYAEAEQVFRDIAERNRRTVGADHPETLRAAGNLGTALRLQGKLAEAESVLSDVLARKRRVLGNDHPDTLVTMDNLGSVLAQQGKSAEAEAIYREALARRRNGPGATQPGMIDALSNMGALLMQQGKLAEAEPYLRDALEARRRRGGDDNPDTLNAMNNLGALLCQQGKFDQAEPMFRQTLNGRRTVYGDDHPLTIGSSFNLGALLLQEGKPADAEPLLRGALAAYRRALGDDHSQTLAAMNVLTTLLMRQDRFAEAEPLAAELYRRAQAAPLPKPLAAQHVWLYGVCLADLHRYDDAAAPLRVASQWLTDTHQQDDPSMPEVVAALADTCEHTGRSDEAARLRASLAARAAATRPASQPAARVTP